MKIIGSKYFLWALVILAVVVSIIAIVSIKKNVWRRKLSDLAINEHAAWNFGKTKESSSAMRSSLTKYWQSANAPDYGAGAAWSAAFISWLFKSMGAGDHFPYASSHSVYIREAVKNRADGKSRGALIGYRPEEFSPRIGDLICYPRQNGITFDTTHSYDSHCDIVVDIDHKNNQVIAIGGNVSNSVSKSKYNLDRSGRVIDQKVHAILKNAI